MAAKFHFNLTDHGIAPMIRLVHARHPQVVSKAFNRVVFEIREDEAAMTAKAFDFWSGMTKSFMASPRAFPFEPATPSKLVAKVHTSAKESVSEIMVKQEEGFTLKPGEGKQLELGASPTFYARPTDDKSAHLRTPRGQVRKAQTPGALIQGMSKIGRLKIRKRIRRRKASATAAFFPSRGKSVRLGTAVFVSPNRKAIIEVTPAGRRRLLYGLYSRAIRVPEHTTFFDTAARTVGRSMIPKLLSEWDRVFGRFAKK